MDTYYMVSLKVARPDGAKIRDGVGHHMPSKIVGMDPVPFLYRPSVPENDKEIKVTEVPKRIVVFSQGTKGLHDNDEFDPEVFDALTEQKELCLKNLAQAKQIKNEENRMNGGFGVRSIYEILKDPDKRPRGNNPQLVEQLKAERRKSAEAKFTAAKQGKEDYSITLTDDTVEEDD